MADANTCELTASQPPKAASKKSFKLLLPEIKRELIKLRHNHDKHEPEYFASVKSLSDQELTSFDESDIVAVRAGRVAYGIIVFGKVRLQSSGKYIFVRWFVGGDDGKDEVDCKFHSFYTEEKPEADADDMCNSESIEDLVELRIQELQERGFPLSTKNFLDWAITQPLAHLQGYRYSLCYVNDRVCVKTSYPGSGKFRDVGIIELLSRNLERNPELRPEQYSVWQSCKLTHSKRWNVSWARDSNIKVSLISTWLRHCDQTHSRCQRKLQITSKQHIDIRLVDVVDQRIVRAKTSFSFFALSYVWGQVSMLSATEANILELEQPGSLQTHAAEIPQTIRDAMEFVSKLGERYLWVDSLCIVQDDNIEKHDQILQMHHIYSAAYATIVQHAGHDANAGLPGVRKGTRSMLAAEAFPRDRAMIAIANYGVPRILSDSVHSSRGWTLQEVLVSNRCLHFFDKHLTFVCTEEYVQDWRSVDANSRNQKRPGPMNETDLCHPSQILDIQRTRLSEGVLWQMNPLAETSELDTTGRHGIQAKWRRCFMIYARIMSDYTSRQLSYESDILAAFHGLESAIERLEAGRFFYGLPSIALDHALLWLPASVTNRRELTKEANIPTWSWAGWAGATTYNCCSTQGKASGIYRLNSFVREFHIVEGNSSILVERAAQTLLEDSLDSPYLQARRAAPPEPRVIPEKTIGWPQGCLHFWAEEANMGQFQCRLSPVSNTAATKSRSSKLFPSLYIVSSNQRCGILASTIDFVTDITAPSMDRSEYPLVLMSESRETHVLREWKAYRVNALFPLRREDIFSGFPNFFGTDLRFYFNVLLVRRKGLFVQRLGFLTYTS
ncbi:heterokaryon incompatibility protein-domain-containing protein [Venturia nashicola]|nr:heterokaryon incompatibility protein-domain-containing protein [Venturia nashicola]